VQISEFEPEETATAEANAEEEKETDWAQPQKAAKEVVEAES